MLYLPDSDNIINGNLNFARLQTGDKKEMAVEQNEKAKRSIARFMKTKDNYDLSLAIQRPEGQWSRKQESAFIESILKDYPVPTLFVIENEDKTMSVIDGKQRLSTIIRFYNNEFALTSDIKPAEIDGELCQLAGKKYNTLPENARIKFNDFTIPIVGITGADEEDMRAIFARLNNGAPLTVAQKRTVAIQDELLQLLNECLTNRITVSEQEPAKEAEAEPPKKKRGRPRKNAGAVVAAASEETPAVQAGEKKYSFWEDISGLGKGARKSGTERDVIFQTLMLMDEKFGEDNSDGDKTISFKDASITKYVKNLQEDKEHMVELFGRLNDAINSITKGMLNKNYGKEQKKNFKKTVLPCAIAAMDYARTESKDEVKYIDGLYDFLTIYKTAEDNDRYPAYEETVKQGTAKAENIEARFDFFKGLAE